MQTLREGVVVGLANPTLLLDKAGTEPPCPTAAAVSRSHELVLSPLDLRG